MNSGYHYSIPPQPRSATTFSRQQGFSLLEMLIAFSMMSLLFLALFSGFNTIGRGWDAADKKMLKTEDMRLISEFLRSQLSQAMVVKIQGEEGAVYAFEGDDDYVRYAAPLQPLQNSGGVYLIELAVGSDKDGRKLEMRYAPYRPELSWDEALDEVEPVLVYAGLRSVKFSYFAAETIDDDPDWESDWVDQVVYPLLIKLELEDKDGKSWPDLVVDLPQVDEYVGGGRAPG
ncbi:MAG: prepilin-type N-terminal cleavage/methylation domain-containing protein [Thiolinea sp.]